MCRLLKRLTGFLLGGKTSQEVAQVAADAMAVAPGFVEALVEFGIQRLQPTGERQENGRSNLLLALHVEPFRRLLAVHALQEIAQRL
jgi:hypothetical protein